MMPSLHDVSPLASGLVLVVWMLAGALLVWFGLRWRRGHRTWGLPVIAAMLLAMSSVSLLVAARVGAETARKQHAVAKPLSPQAQAVWRIVQQRCQACHSVHATVMPWARYGLSLNAMEDVERNATPIYRQVVELQAMPMGNTTQMTAEERATIARWYATRAH